MKFTYKFLFIMFFGLVLLSSKAFAQTDPCDTSDKSVIGKSNAQLQADLDACMVVIGQLEKSLSDTKKNTANYASEVAKLTARINTAQAAIKSKTIAISKLNTNISQKQTEIDALEVRIDSGRDHIADLVRKTNQIDSFSVAEAILSDKDFSNFFADVDAFSSTRASLVVAVDNLRGVKSDTEEKKAELAKQRDAEAAAKAEIEANKKKVEVDKATQNTLLTQSKNQEKAYNQVLSEKRAKAEAIRTALFGLRDAESIPFGTALQYAQDASVKTGVRAALILGILQQESNLGANTGSCVITDLSSGQTRNVNSGRVYSNGIHPTRDLPLIQDLLNALGRSALSTRVSCPLSIGYGGAMGPAQFIPSTWRLIEKQVGSLANKTNPDPWNPADAIMALAILLKNNGAAAGTYSAERTAACKYYGGGTVCSSRTATYGNQVMSRAGALQANIDLLQST